ncbi:hypothetical protein AYO45_00875 [Gammaproteobacteria bacterium SCGC AG-212-F23]|nr:hypothetical protein AYO45_00875 [Gammaproteobacteria bacterium SCGC AG-212-F23]
MWSWLCGSKNNQSVNNSALAAPLIPSEANGTKEAKLETIIVHSGTPSTPSTPQIVAEKKINPAEFSSTQKAIIALAAHSHMTAGASLPTLAIFYFKLTEGLPAGVKLPIYAVALFIGFTLKAWQDKRNNVAVLEKRNRKNTKDAKENSSWWNQFSETVSNMTWPKRFQFLGEFAEAYATSLAVYGPIITDIFGGPIYTAGLSTAGFFASNAIGVSSAIGEASMHVATSDHIDRRKTQAVTQ